MSKAKSVDEIFDNNDNWDDGFGVPTLEVDKVKQQLLQLLLEKMPEKEKEVSGDAYLGHALGFNQALDEVEQCLRDLFGGNKDGK